MEIEAKSGAEGLKERQRIGQQDDETPSQD
jgi:hypothetical protein